MKTAPCPQAADSTGAYCNMSITLRLTIRSKHADVLSLAQSTAGDDGKLVMGVLPLAYFASGHVYFTQRMHETLGIQPYAVHATFQFSGTPGKKNRFREAGLWLEQYEYYRPKSECGFEV